MNRIRTLFLLAAMGWLPGALFAEPVSADEAKTAVTAWLQERAALGCPLGGSVSSVRTCEGNGARFHVVSLSEGGFVVTSADTEVEPIIAFSSAAGAELTADNPLMTLLTRDLSARGETSEQTVSVRKSAASATSSTPAGKWRKLLHPTVRRSTLSVSELTASDLRVSPILKTLWRQQEDSRYAGEGSPCYNYYTPDHCPCGCVATAGGQVMRHFRYPTGPVVPGTYACSVSGQSVLLTMQGGIYDWDAMPEDPNEGTTEAQRQAIGKLTSDIGIACGCDYWSSVSYMAVYMLAPALENRFGYANATPVVVASGCGRELLASVLLPNLDAKLPVIVSLEGLQGGHAVVADGYGYSGGTLYVHLNMGWAGLDDAWYALPLVDANRYNSNIVNGFVCNIYPTGAPGRVICSGRVTLEGSQLPQSGVVVSACATSSDAVVQETVTDENGVYALLLPPGTYSVVAETGAEALTRQVTLKPNVATEVLSNGMYYPTPAPQVNNVYGQDFQIATPPVPPEPIVVSFDAAGGALGVGQETLQAFSGRMLGTLPEPVRDGFMFGGWFATGSETEVTATSRLTADTTLRARWDVCFTLPERLASVDRGVAVVPVSASDFVNPKYIRYLSVSGLPKGLAYNASTMTVSGTPSEAGTYALRFAVTVGSRVVTAVAELTVLDYPGVTVELSEEDAAAGCKVTGAGNYKVGTKITLKASATKGFGFARWTDPDGKLDELYTAVQLQSATLAYVVGRENPRIRAAFVRVADDGCQVETLLGEERFVRLAPGEPVAGTVGISTVSAVASLKLSGLPAGLKFDAKTGAVSGAATKDGVFFATASVKNANGYAHSKVFVITVGETPTPGFAEELTVGESCARACSAKSVAGLPTGLKFDAKAGRISGTCTKSGVFTVKYTSESGVESRLVLVRDPGSCHVAVTARTAGGTVTGTGVYAIGATAKMSAKADKGYVFAGWYADAELTVPLSGSADFRTASFSRTVRGEGDEAYARFVSVAEDQARLSVETDAAYETAKDGSFDLTIPVESLSVPKLSVKGLPAGLKFDAKTNRITGTTRKPGVYTVTVSATNQSVKKAVLKAFVLTVPNIESAVLPGLKYGTDAYPISAGVTVSAGLIDLTATDGYVVTAMSGLPAGLKFDAKTGLLSGVPTKAGSFTVTITARQGTLTTTATVTLSVSALPTWAYGTFDGHILDGDEVDGLATLTVTAAGKVSGKLICGGRTWTLTAPALTAYVEGATPEQDVYLAELVGKSGKQAFTNELVFCAESADLIAGVRRGRLEMAATERCDVVFETWQNLWKTEPFKTLAKDFANRTVDLDGVSLKTSATGTVTAAGLFGSVKSTCSSVLVPLGDDVYQVSLAFAPVAGKFEGAAGIVRLTWDPDAQNWSVFDGGLAD